MIEESCACDCRMETAAPSVALCSCRARTLGLRLPSLPPLLRGRSPVGERGGERAGDWTGEKERGGRRPLNLASRVERPGVVSVSRSWLGASYSTKHGGHAIVPF